MDNNKNNLKNKTSKKKILITNIEKAEKEKSPTKSYNSREIFLSPQILIENEKRQI